MVSNERLLMEYRMETITLIIQELIFIQTIKKTWHYLHRWGLNVLEPQLHGHVFFQKEMN